MKFSSVLLIFASSLIVGCAGSSPVAPDALSNARAISPASTSQAFFPPIDPAGISCPSDAPQIWVGSLGSRMDIEFSAVTGASAYEIEIVDKNGVKVRLEVPAPAHRAEWYGLPGLYRIRVRTINCGGLGKWSAEFIHSIDDPTPPPPSEPGPQCPQGVQSGGCEPHCAPSMQSGGCEPQCQPTMQSGGCQPPQCMQGGCEPPSLPQCMQSCEPPPPPCTRYCDDE